MKTRRWLFASTEVISAQGGRMLAFVDSDDFLAPGHIDTLAHALTSAGVDYVTARWSKVNELGKRRRLAEISRIHGGVCARMYRREVWSKLCFPDGFWFEDTVQAYCVENRFSKLLLSDAGYCRRGRRGSLSRSVGKSYRSLDSYWIVEEMIQWCRELDIPLGQNIYELTVRQFGPLLFSRVSALSEEEHKALFIACSDFIESIDEFDGLAVRNAQDQLMDLNMALRTKNYKWWRAICSS